jgi:hypothetical protein
MILEEILIKNAAETVIANKTKFKPISYYVYVELTDARPFTATARRKCY